MRERFLQEKTINGLRFRWVVMYCSSIVVPQSKTGFASNIYRSFIGEF